MPRFLPRQRTRRTATQAAFENAREAQQREIRREIQRILRRESQQLLKEWQESFARSLQEELRQSLSTPPINSAPATSTGTSGSNLFGAIGNISINPTGITNFLGRAVGILISRPRISRTSSETARSAQTQQAFRTSRAQELADTNNLLSNGERNL